MIIPKVSSYLKTRSWYWYAALIITAAGGFLRFFRIPQTVMFLGDQGRDALVVARMFKEIHPALIGPVTSVGNMYLGPLYYYFMMPFLWLSYPSPLGPVYAVAFFSTLTIFITYLVAKEMFSKLTGLLAAFFFAFAVAAIELSRFSWNPNLAPLLSILMIYFCWKALRDSKNWIWVAVFFSAIIQLHYLTLLTGISAGLLWVISAIRVYRLKNMADEKRLLIKHSLISLLIVIASFAPLVAFDIRHGGINYNAFGGMFRQEKIFTHRQSQGVIDRVGNVIANSQSRARSILVDVMMLKQRSIENYIVTVVAISLIYLAFKSKKKSQKTQDALITLLSFVVVGVLGTAAYQHPVYFHYIAYLIPVTAIAYALTLRLLHKLLKTLSIPLIVGAMIGYLLITQPNWPIKPNNNYFNTQTISAQIAQLLEADDRYELVLLSETKDLYAQSYRYFLSTTSNPPVIRDKGEKPNTLIIIDEEKIAEDVTALPIYEIQTFESKEIDFHLQNQDLADIYILRTNLKN